MKLKNALKKAAALAALAAAPASGQAAPGVAAKPDFQGIWAHPWLPGFEALASGPTALVNLSRTPEGRDVQTQLSSATTESHSQAEAAEAVRKFGEAVEVATSASHNPANQCWPNGIPFIAVGQWAARSSTAAITLTMIYREDHRLRTVRMNASHPANVKPSYYGDSVGHYEGDTLVIDTVAIKPGQFAMIDWFGTPQTPALHVVERYRLIDYDQAQEAVKRANKDNVLPQFNNPPVVDFNSQGKWLQLKALRSMIRTSSATHWSATVTFGPAVQSVAPGANAWPEKTSAAKIHKCWARKRMSKLPTAKCGGISGTCTREFATCALAPIAVQKRTLRAKSSGDFPIKR